ncbi:aldo/keto reductase [Kocuria sabuli]|uniref:aldo/keto reductase n=1 Tax=Kocuria sabuli TaxID=3071448 RepID=UPI0034D757F8
MEYRTLGHSGTVVSAQALGTMTFGAEADEATSHQILTAFAEGGGTFLDTADVYSAGAAEQIIGRRLTEHPTEAAHIVLTTKGRFPTGTGPNDLGLSRRHLRTALEESLTRLGVEHIDLYQLHAWDELIPLEETLRFLDDAMTAGKISYYGFSNYLGWQLTKAVHVATAHGWAAPVTLQPQYNLLVRDIEHEIVPAALDAGCIGAGRPTVMRWPVPIRTSSRLQGAVHGFERPDDDTDRQWSGAASNLDSLGACKRTRDRRRRLGSMPCTPCTSSTPPGRSATTVWSASRRTCSR